MKRAVRGEEEEGRKNVEKKEKLKYIEKKKVEKGVQRLERHPGDGLPLGKQPKGGRGGKYTWEGPEGSEIYDVPTVFDESDPDYVDDEREKEELVVADVEVAKVQETGGVANHFTR